MEGFRPKLYIFVIIIAVSLMMLIPLAGIVSAESAVCDHVHDESCGEDGAECKHDCSDGTCAVGRAAAGRVSVTGAPDFTILTDYEAYEDRYSYAAGTITLDELMANLPATLEAADDSGNNYIIEVSWVCAEFDPAPANTTEYIFTVALPWDFKFAEDADKPQITVLITRGEDAGTENPPEEVFINIDKYAKTFEIGAALFDALDTAKTVYVSGHHSAAYYYGHGVNIFIPRDSTIIWGAYFENNEAKGGDGLLRISGSGNFVLATGGALMMNAGDFSAITVSGGAALRVEGGTIYGAPAIFIESPDQSTIINGGTVCSRIGPVIYAENYEKQNITINSGFVYSGIDAREEEQE